METLITDRLILREWRESDSADLYEYAQSELVGPRAGWQPHKSEDESKERIKMFINGKDTYAIVLKSEKKVIGSIGLHDRKPDKTLERLNQKEIGYVLNPKYWGNGYVPEAVRQLIDYGFNNLNLDLIWCAHNDHNNNSRRVIEKCGFNYQFKINEKLIHFNDKEVTVLYYNIFRNTNSN